MKEACLRFVALRGGLSFVFHPDRNKAKKTAVFCENEKRNRNARLACWRGDASALRARHLRLTFARRQVHVLTDKRYDIPCPRISRDVRNAQGISDPRRGPCGGRPRGGASRRTTGGLLFWDDSFFRTKPLTKPEYPLELRYNTIRC